MADADFSVKAIISAQTSQFEKGMKNAQSSINSMSKSIGGLQKLLKNVFSVAAIGTAVKAITDFGKSAVEAADKANAQFRILSNTIKVTGASAWTSEKDLENMSKSYAKNTNYSVTEIQKMQTVLLGFKNITGETFNEASEAIMDMSTVMGMDLTSAVQTVGKALDDPIKGLDSLRRQGFAFTDEQKEELAQLVKNGEQLKAQKIILDELATTYGGAAKQAQSYSSRMKFALDELKETLGNKLKPLVESSTNATTKMIENLTKVLKSEGFQTFINVVTNLSKKVKEVVEKITSYFSELHSRIKALGEGMDLSPLLSFFDTLAFIISELIKELKKGIDEIISFFEKLKSKSKESGESFLDLSKIVEIVNSIINVLWFLRDQIKKIIEQIANLIFKWINYIWSIIKELFTNTEDALVESQRPFESWGDFFYETFNSVFKFTQDVINFISSLLSGDWVIAWEYAKLTVVRVVKGLLDVISQFASTGVNLFISAINKLIEAYNFLAEKINLDPADLLEPWQGFNLSESLGLNEEIEEIENKIKETSGKEADYSIKELARFSKNFKGFSKGFLKDLITGQNAAEDVAENIRETCEENGKKTEKQNKKLLDKIKKAFGSLKDTIKEDAEDWSDVVIGSYNTMKDAAADTFFQIGESLVEGGQSFDDYAATAVSAVSEVLKSLGQQLVATAALRAANYDFATAAAAAAAATAAFVAAGVLGGIANKMKETSKSSKETSENIREIGDSAKYAKGSIEYFRESLKNLIESFEKYSVPELYKNLNSLLNLYSENLEAISEKLIEVEKKFAEFTEYTKHNVEQIPIQYIVRKLEFINATWVPTEWEVVYTRNLEWVRLENEYINSQKELEELKKLAAETARTIINTLDNTIETLKESISVSDNAIKAYEMLYTSQTALNEAMEEFNLLSFEEQAKDYEKYVDALENGSSSIIETLSFQLDYFKKFTEVIFLEQKSAISQMVSEVYSGFSSTGVTIGERLISGIIDGTGKKNFLLEMKKYIREVMIKLAVYTDSFKDKLASVGVKLSEVLISKGDLTEIKKELSDLWDTATKSAKNAEKVISEVFSDIKEDIEDSIESVGKNIFDNLISALSDGLSQGEFLESMKKYIRDMLIQTLVYTETLKSEIQSIGEAISKGITEGFTETSFHEIKRDLSYVFDQANKTLSNIDVVMDRVFGNGYANGTNNATRGIHLVGEAGPELVKFRGGEQVLNNRNTQSVFEGVGETTVNQNITFNNLQDTSAFAILQQIKQYNREMAVNGII